MAVTLATNINATQQRVTLTEPLIAEPGDLFRIGDEAVEFGGYGRTGPGLRLVDHSGKIVSFTRGVGTTAAASHLSGVAVLRVVDSLVSGVTEPEPWASGGGGGTAPATLPKTQYAGDPVTISDAGNDYLTWDDIGDGDEILDRSDLKHPTVLLGGIYSVTVVVESLGMTPDGGGMGLELHLDSENRDAVCEMKVLCLPDGTQVGAALASLNNTWYIPADGGISVRVRNYDGTVSITPFLREAMIQAIALDPA